MPEQVPFCYCVVHQAVAKRPGVLASQVWHAARECIGMNSRDVVDRNSGCPVSELEVVCALEAKSSDDLELLSVALQQGHIRHKLIREPDEPWNGSATSVGIDAMDPETRARVRPLLAQFKLLR